MKIDKIVISRVIKSIYMGFILNKKSNEYLGKQYEVVKEDILKFIDVFNKNTDLKFNRINIEYDENSYGTGIRVRAIGNTTYLTNEKIHIFYSDIEELINRNLKLATTSNEHIEVYDLNTFDLLDRHIWNTMGDKYLASTSKRYMVNFIHLYSVSDY